ncbi:MAG: ABC transporter permease [Acidobacteria bacterium]|nr:ABC transporter permease [Acidobacteriota bacterium]
MELTSPGDFAKERVQAIQDWSVMAWRSITNLFRRPRYFGDIVQQADTIGVGSVPIIALTGVSIGGSLALNTASSLQQFGVTSMTGQLVAISMVTEIGPILTALLVAGRNGSGIASELGSMKVTEQIDAMRALGTDPFKKLVTPRVISSVVMVFFLTIISDLCGLVGGWMISRTMLGLNTNQYWTSTYQNLTFGEVVRGLVKPVVFGFVIGTVGCYYGLNTKGGTRGVGLATTQAVVTSSILILVIDFFLTRLLLVFWPT